jgi:hypothetical protein
MSNAVSPPAEPGVYLNEIIPSQRAQRSQREIPNPKHSIPNKHQNNKSKNVLDLEF